MARNRKASREFTPRNRHQITPSEWEFAALEYAREMHEDNFHPAVGPSLWRMWIA
jgi:hypothetical protein